MHVLVINSGSSSIKIQVFDTKPEDLLVSAKLERIGEADSQLSCHEYSANNITKKFRKPLTVADHKTGIKHLLTFLSEQRIFSANSNTINRQNNLHSIGHRVVHGGENFSSPTLIDNHVIDKIREMIPLAPLHNPANLAGIEIMRELYPEIPQVAVFDTAFFQTLPPHAYRYALPEEMYKKHHVRRYGFHGTSHQFIAKKAAEHLQQPLNELKLITLHLGNGASAAAIDYGICIDTSMGMTPLEGLIMGTRCGDIDPSIPFYLSRALKTELNKIETMLNQNSGLKGLCGVNDMREVHHLANDGNENAKLAIDMFCYRICKTVGAYFISLSGLDAVVFAGGIGEHDALIREVICNKLSVLGIQLDHQKNINCTRDTYTINSEESKVKVLVVETNEALEIARQVEALIKEKRH